MMFYTEEVTVLGHGHEIASKLQGSTPHDQLLIQTSESFSGLLLFTIGFVLFMVAFVKDGEFQSFFAKGCVLVHVSMAIWRVCFEGKLLGFGHEWLFGEFVYELKLLLFYIQIGLGHVCI